MARTRPDIQSDPTFRRYRWRYNVERAWVRRHVRCVEVPGRVTRPCRRCRNPRRGVVLTLPQKGRTSEPRGHRADAPA